MLNGLIEYRPVNLKFQTTVIAMYTTEKFVAQNRFELDENDISQPMFYGI